jgi:thioredoxin-like negative regulator of GroEL
VTLNSLSPGYNDATATGTNIMPTIRSLSQFDFYHVLAETPGVSLVFFTGPDCGACNALRELLENTPIKPVENLFEVDAASDEGLARDFDVFHLPALFLFKDGTYHRALQSVLVPDALRSAIKDCLKLPAEEMP